MLPHLGRSSTWMEAGKIDVSSADSCCLQETGISFIHLIFYKQLGLHQKDAWLSKKYYGQQKCAVLRCSALHEMLARCQGRRASCTAALLVPLQMRYPNEVMARAVSPGYSPHLVLTLSKHQQEGQEQIKASLRRTLVIFHVFPAMHGSHRSDETGPRHLFLPLLCL